MLLYPRVLNTNDEKDPIFTTSFLCLLLFLENENELFDDQTITWMVPIDYALEIRMLNLLATKKFPSVSMLLTFNMSQIRDVFTGWICKFH